VNVVEAVDDIVLSKQGEASQNDQDEQDVPLA